MTDEVRKPRLIAWTLASRARPGKALVRAMVAGLVLAGSALAAPQAGPATSVGTAPAAVGALPKAVQAYLDRRTGCRHWGGEEPYDAARARAIEAAIRKLRCDALDADDMRLRRLHARVPMVEDALDKARAADD